PPVEFEPRLIFVVFIPPLLYRAALTASWRDLRANVRPITLLAVGLVVFTTLVVGVAAHALAPGLPWAAGFALGALVSPPDAPAATAFLRGLVVPRRIATILEGESPVNDAAAIVACGLYLGRQGPRIVAPDTRVQTEGMWGVIGFVLEGLTFIFVGLELRTVLGTLGAYSVRQLALAGVAVSLATIAARVVWVF